MNLEQAIILIITGAIAGWLCGLIVKGKGFGILGNIVIGILGAILGTWIFGALDISLGGEWIGDIIRALIGALVLIFALRLVRK